VLVFLLLLLLLSAPAAAEGGEAPQPPGASLDEATKAKQLEGLFLFALVWSTGATCDSAGRVKFDNFFRCALLPARHEKR
jgi:hypothetical protein